MNDEKKKLTKYEAIIKSKISGLLGIEIEDINNDDFLKDDLHMNSAEITDLVHILNSEGLNIALSDIAKIESVDDLVEIVAENEEF